MSYLLLSYFPWSPYTFHHQYFFFITTSSSSSSLEGGFSKLYRIGRRHHARDYLREEDDVLRLIFEMLLFNYSTNDKMATRRRDIAPRKDNKVPSPSNTPTQNLPSKPNYPQQNRNPTRPRKNIHTSPKSDMRTSANVAHTQQVTTRPISIDTLHKSSQKTHVSTNPYLRPRDKTPLPSRRTHVIMNPSIRSRDKTSLPAQKTHLSTIPSPHSRDKTPLPSQRTHVPASPSMRDKTPLSTRKVQVPINSSHRSRDKTPLPAQKRQVSTDPSIRDKTPLSARKTQVSTNLSTKPRDKTPLPTRKTHVTISSNPSVRSSSVPRKSIIASQKMVPDKSSKPLNRDVGECGSLPDTLESYTLKTSDNIYITEQEIEKITTSPTKEQITNTFQKYDENSSIQQNRTELKILLKDQELCTIAEDEEQIIQVVSNDEKGTVYLVLEDQEKLLDIAQFGVENDNDDGNKDAKIVINESSPILEEQEASVDRKTQESEERLYIEDKLKEGENSVHKIDNADDINRSVENDYPKEDGKENEVKAVEKEEEPQQEENASDKKHEADSIETKMQEVENKQENVAKKQEGSKKKKDSVISNDVIEATANKLRDQRTNRVRALAGAFETVISLQ